MEGPQVNKGDVLLILAVSARALAQAARRAGLTPVAIDAFGDEDSRIACAELSVAQDATSGFAGIDLGALVKPLLRAHKPVGIVYGSGFDDCPEQLRRLAERLPLLGASASTVAATKNHIAFAGLCSAVGLRHPEIATAMPSGPEQWLLKRAGGCGGHHIRDGRAKANPGAYWQRRIEGRGISLLFTRDEQRLTPIAWSEQWTAPVDAAPYRYGGAAGPLEFPQSPEVFAGLCRLTDRLGLRGLASADFLDDGANLWLLEVNPRPGATLDVFDNDDDPLLRRHLSSLAGSTLSAAVSRKPRAAAIVYAHSNIVAPSARWPEWVADRPAPGIAIAKGAPICTVHAEGGTVSSAKSLLFERVRLIHEFAEGSAT